MRTLGSENRRCATYIVEHDLLEPLPVRPGRLADLVCLAFLERAGRPRPLPLLRQVLQTLRLFAGPLLGTCLFHVGDGGGGCPFGEYQGL